MQTVEEYKKKSNRGNDVVIRILDPSISSAPTVVLFGWLGASVRNLSKYATIYEAMGYNTVKLVSPTSVVFSMRPATNAKFLLSVLRILAADDRLHAGGLVFHLFSNGGAILAPHLSKFLAGNYADIIPAEDKLVIKKCKESIAAIVFDSAPVYMHAVLGANALNVALRTPPGFIAMFVFTLFTLGLWIQRIFFCDAPTIFWKGITKARYLCPEQYIFSTADTMIDINALEALIQRRKSEGNELRVFRVEDADHVLILRKHSEKYVEVIRALNEWGVNAWHRRTNTDKWPIPNVAIMDTTSGRITAAAKL